MVELLLRPGVRVVTMTGAPGIGKTRLAVEAARSAAGRFRDGAAFIDLSTVTDPTLVLSAIAQELAVRDVPGMSILDAVCLALTDAQLKYLSSWEEGT